MQKYEVKMEYVSEDVCKYDGLKKTYTIIQVFGGSSFTVVSCADCDKAYDEKKDLVLGDFK